MRIAIVGTGISGLTAAHHLHPHHDLTVYEANDYIGGHTHTVDVPVQGQTYAVDTGFIVYNERTYPEFIRLMAELRVPSHATAMSLSVRDARSGLEYCGSGLDGLFAQRSNLLRPGFWALLRGILRFNRELRADLPNLPAAQTLAEYLARRRVPARVIEQYVNPMVAAVWSADYAAVRGFPVRFLAEFFENHGLLAQSQRPQWRVLTGGSRSYIGPLCAPFASRIRLQTPVVGVRGAGSGVLVRTADGHTETYDQVILACHADQSLAMLEDATETERSVLGALPYQRNEVVLHTDTRLLPARRRAWGCWNYLVQGAQQPAVVTYNMNLLQGLKAPVTFCVTLNHTAAIDPAKVLRRLVYHHPVYTASGVGARAARAGINGVRGLWYAGAYWHHGFHEDGVRSGLDVVRALKARAQGAPSSGAPP